MLGRLVQFLDGGDVKRGILAYKGPKFAKSRVTLRGSRYWAIGECDLFDQYGPPARRYKQPGHFLVRVGTEYYSPTDVAIVLL